MSRRSKRKPDDSHANTDRWLLTYSDLITLLMIFFVIMYAMSKVDQVKFYALQQSLSQAMHQSQDQSLQGVGKNSILSAANPSDVGNKLKQAGATQTQTQDDQTFNNLYQEIKQYIQQHNLQANVTIADQVRGIQVTFRDVVLFDTGQANLKPHAKEILNGLIPFIQKVNNPVVIEGYTDNQPIHTSQYASNWELSASRAINVVKYFGSQHVNPTRLSGVGYGQYHPVAPNDSAANRQKNRRVNIVIMRNQGTQTAPVQSSTASSAQTLAGLTATSSPPANSTNP
jgi:chemotaxis protein MotB